MKKKKKQVIIVLCCILAFIGSCVLYLRGCAYRIEKPQNTTLEFWITEEVENRDLDGYQEKYGLFGGEQYYGSGYVPTYGENNNQIDPEACVVYTVTSYPDYLSKSKAITGIYISDPEVSVYGLTLNSSAKEIREVMAAEGYKNTENKTFKKGKVTVTFSNKSISMKADVTNKFGIVY